MLLVGVDDTDSPVGGCTTALAQLLLDRFSSLQPDGPPRLVRLNPNVPWKTRGNAAIALRFLDDADLDQALAKVLAIVHQHAQRHERTEPGIVVAREAPPAWLYDAAVTRIVTRDEVDAALAKIDARAWGGRGVIGAAAALAWDPGAPAGKGRGNADLADLSGMDPRDPRFRVPREVRRYTYERIAYRAPDRMGTLRAVAPAWVREVEWGYPSIFDSYDLANDEIVCVPSGPDPVLWGLRGEDPEELALASAILGPERPDRETLFLTNQGSDDHLVDRAIAQCEEYLSARVGGRVTGDPVDQHGTVLFSIADATGELRCAAYPPTRQLRFIAHHLAVGDDITVCGGIHAGPDGKLTLGIEKLQVHTTAPRYAGAPVCERCGRTMESAGKGAGYRCREHHTRADAPRTAESLIRPGWYEVPSSARRHLAKPLKRNGASSEI